MEDITHLIGHVLEHSIEDTLYLIPFLFVTYLAMEWLEHKAGDKAEEAVRRAGAAGPVVGAVVGIVPQCGFSAAAATLWAGRVITLGTLFAVFLSTSDEMLPIFLAEQVAPMTILKIMGVKLIIGMVMGFVVDAAIRLARRDREKLRIHELCERDHCHCNGDCETCEQQPELAYDFEHDEEHEHHHHHDDDEDERDHHCCHHHHDDEDEHDHHCCHHHHDDDDGHEHHHHHHADEVFTSWGVETAKKFDRASVEAALHELDSGKYGTILRAKGILPAVDGTWIHFDYVPEECSVRTGSADITGKLCVIGSKLDEAGVAALFGV